MYIYVLFRYVTRFLFLFSRLFDSAKALAFSNVPTRDQVTLTNFFYSSIIFLNILYRVTCRILVKCSPWYHYNVLTLCNTLQVKEAIFKTLIRNGMFSNVHIRLTLTRGKKVLLVVHFFSFILVNSETLKSEYLTFQLEECNLMCMEKNIYVNNEYWWM